MNEVNEILQIQNINNNSELISKKLKYLMGVLDEEHILKIIQIIQIFNKDFDLDKELQNTKEVNKELVLQTLMEIADALFIILENLYIISNNIKTDFENIIQSISSIIQELSIYIFQYKYNINRYEAKNKIEFTEHYENILKESGLDKLYEELNTYFLKEIEKKNIEKETIRSEYEPYFHNEEFEIDTEESFHIVFQINKNCNFKCTYCYEGLDKVTEILKEEDIPKFVQGIKNFQKDLKARGEISKISFSMLGGEPTIVNQKITHKLTKMLFDEIDLKYIILITNNYSADRTMNFFHPDFPKELIKIQVSYDGGVIQDDYRKDSKKNGSKEQVTKEIHKLLNRGYKISLKATLPIEAIGSVPNAVKDYIKFEEVLNNNNNNPGNFAYYPTFDTTSILMYKLRQSILYGDESGKEKLFKDIDETFRFLLKFEIDRLINNKKAFTRWFREMSYTANNILCSAGMGLFGLDQDGNGRYCHRTEFGDTITQSTYKKEQMKSLEYGNITESNFITNFHETKEKLEKAFESKKLDDFSYCSSCKTLTCVKCPMINITPDRSMDTSTSLDLYTDMYSHGLTLACEINNYISRYLYIFDKIINK